MREEAAHAYLELIDRVLEDRVISSEETASLCQLAASWGFAIGELSRLHRRYVDDLIAAAMADDLLTRDEHEDLCRVADLLGVPRTEVFDDLTGGEKLDGAPNGKA